MRQVKACCNTVAATLSAIAIFMWTRRGALN